MSRIVKALKFLFSQRRLRAQEKITFIGQDHLGNKFYERCRPSDWRVNRRYFERTYVKEGEDFADLTRVPPAWDAWLRYRRKDPPSPEEVEESERYFRTQQQLLAKEKENAVTTPTSQENQPQNDTNKFPKRDGYSLRPYLDPEGLKYEKEDPKGSKGQELPKKT